MKKQFKGTLMLLLTALFWGFAFVTQTTAMDHVGPFTFQAVRQMIGFLVLLPVIAFRDKMGIAVRTGTHCTEPIMQHFGIPGTVRASISFYNTAEEIDILHDSLLRAVNMLK